MGDLLCFACGHPMSEHWASGGVATCTHTDNHGRICGCELVAK